MKTKIALLIWFLLLPAVANADLLFKNSPFSSIISDMKSPAGSGAQHPENKVLLIDNGYDALLLRVHLIQNATRSIKIQTFIWRNDECGRLIMYELIEAAKRGVKVQVLADNIASEQDPEVTAFLATVHENLDIKLYRPVAGRIKSSPVQVFLKSVFKLKELNQRMHNKVMIFDDTMALTGGRNIENTYYNHSTDMNFKDLDILAVGPVVSDICTSFGEFWNYKHSVLCQTLTDVADAIATGSSPRPQTRADFSFNGFFKDIDTEADTEDIIQEKFISKIIAVDKIEFISDTPGKNKSFWLGGQGRATRKIKTTLKKARQSLTIQSPYLILSGTAQKVFRQLRKDIPELEVTISTNSFGSADKTIVYSANYRLRPLYIQDLKFTIYEYKPLPSDLLKVFPAYPQLAALASAKNEGPPFLCVHSKAMVVDDQIAFIGSYNLDPRSGNLNTECGLLIEDPTAAAMLKEKILDDCKPDNSWVIAKKKMPLQLDKLNAITEGLSGIIPIDIWPIRNTSSFELIAGKTPLPTDDPDFYSHYRDIGSFPDMENDAYLKQMLTMLYKTVGGLATPLF